MIYQLRKDLHMTADEVLWGESWANITMMLADSPRYTTAKGGPLGLAEPEEMSDEDLIKYAESL